eukprot:CCRYP_007177-RA/>CCRYP_007177-RA protein AED:0.39 eAED:0.76 QI:0/0/0/1/0/0/2/0/200
MQAEEDPSPAQHSDLMNFVFANCSEENVIYLLTVQEIAAAQHTDKTLDKLSLLEAYKPQLVENVQVLCKDGKLSSHRNSSSEQYSGTITTCSIQGQPVSKRLFALRCFGKGCDILSAPLSKIVINAKSTNNANAIVSNPWEVLCVDLIGPYTLKGKAGPEIDFMYVTMIDPVTSWFEIVELPVTEFNSVTPKGKKGLKKL